MFSSNTQDPAPVREMETNHPSIIGFHIDNEPTKADYIFMNNLLSSHLKEQERLLLMLQLERLIDIEIDYIFQELETAINFHKNQTRIAIIAIEKMKLEITMGKLAIPNVELQYFPPDKLNAAEQWLETLESSKV